MKEEKMQNLRKAAQQALDYLEQHAIISGIPIRDALRAALAEATIKDNLTVEPVAYVTGFSKGYATVQPVDPCLLMSVGMALYRSPPTSRESRQVEPVANDPGPYHLSRILHELAGAASMCWEHVDRAGVFQSTQAAEFVAAAIDEIRQRMKDAPPGREPLTDEETLAALGIDGYDSMAIETARAIERAHGIGGEE